MILRQSILVALVVVGVVGLVAALTALSGSQPAARDLLGLDMVGLRGRGDEVAVILERNSELAAIPLTGAAVVSPPWAHRAVGAVATMLLVLNCVLLGLAAGAYGGPVLGPHMAFEAAAFALAGGAYRAGPRLGRRHLAVGLTTACVWTLLTMGAILEVYWATPTTRFWPR